MLLCQLNDSRQHNLLNTDILGAFSNNFFYNLFQCHTIKMVSHLFHLKSNYTLHLRDLTPQNRLFSLHMKKKLCEDFMISPPFLPCHWVSLPCASFWHMVQLQDQ